MSEINVNSCDFCRFCIESTCRKNPPSHGWKFPQVDIVSDFCGELHVSVGRVKEEFRRLQAQIDSLSTPYGVRLSNEKKELEWQIKCRQDALKYTEEKISKLNDDEK